MALVLSVLESEIRKIIDQEFEQFEGFPQTAQETATRWANAIDIYASSVIPPSTTTQQAKQSLESIFLGLNVNGALIFPLGFTVYASILATGMLPLFVSVPPPSPIVLAPVFAAGLSGAPSSTCAQLMSVTIDAWFRTGTATPSSGGPAIPWS